MSEYTSEDIKRLAGAMRRRKDNDESRPFSLLTGAGCSKSAGMPLARELVQLINEQYPHECKSRLNENECQDYGSCMGILTTNERKGLLGPYLEKAKVNWGHLAIAAMMEAGYIGRVLTFNFDSILARSCGLLGIYPATYDFVSGATSRTDYIANQAILHLHGQGHSLAMLNSTEETKAHADNLKPLLATTLNRSPLLVIGYSGNSDAVFPIIEAQYTASERLYWAGYDKNPEIHIQGILGKGKLTSEYLGGADSDLFLIELANALGCWPPKLFADPYGHILDELGPVANYPQTADENVDLLKQLKKELTLKQKEKQGDETTILAMKGEWDKIVDVIGDKPKNENERTNLTWAYINQGDVLRKNGIKTKDEKLLRESIEKYNLSLSIDPNTHVAYINLGIAYRNLATIEKDQALFQKSIESYEAALKINPDSFVALYNISSTFMGHYKLSKSEVYREKAHETLTKAKELNPDELYNFACLYSLTGDEKKCKEALLHCHEQGTLPRYENLNNDDDLDNMRSKKWFKELLKNIQS